MSKKNLPKGIREKENGSFIVDITIDQKRITRTLKTLPEALKVLGEIQLGQTLQIEKNITLSQAIQHCIKTQWNNSRSLASINTAIKHITNYFGENYKLNKLSAGVVSNFTNSMLNAGVKPSSINQYLMRLNTIYYRAFDDGYVDKPIKIRKLKVKSLNKTQLTEEIFYDLVKYFSDKRKYYYTDLLYVLFYTGMRIGEVLSLKDENINFKEWTITIWENKTDHPRTIPILKEIRTLLKERRNAGLFSTITYANFMREFNLAKKHLNISDDITPHSFRHYFLSNLAKRNANASLIQAWAGHKSIITSQRYIHLTGADLKKFAEEHLEDA